LPAGEQGGEGFALAMSDLKGEKAVWFECFPCLRDEAAVDVEAGFASEEGGGGFVIADLGVEGGAVGLGDVGWVADDGVVSLCFVRDRFQKIGLEEVDAAGDGVFTGVGGCDGEGPG
jgi:hypothetical protein